MAVPQLHALTIGRAERAGSAAVGPRGRPGARWFDRAPPGVEEPDCSEVGVALDPELTGVELPVVLGAEADEVAEVSGETVVTARRWPWRHTPGSISTVLWVPPDPPLQGLDLVLRPFRAEDAPSVVAACTDPDIPRFTFMKDGLTEDEAIEWIERSNKSWPAGHPRFAIVDRVDERLLGQVGVAVNEHYRSAEAFYWVASDARQRGVASSALALIADWVFANGVERLSLLVHPENEASSSVAKRCGFVREGVLRAYEPFKGGRPDLVSWSLLPSDPRPWRTGSA